MEFLRTVATDRQVELGNINFVFVETKKEFSNYREVYIPSSMCEGITDEDEDDIINGVHYIITTSSNSFIDFVQCANEYYHETDEVIYYYSNHVFWFILDFIIALYPGSLEEHLKAAIEIVPIEQKEEVLELAVSI